MGSIDNPDYSELLSAIHFWRFTHLRHSWPVHIGVMFSQEVAERLSIFLPLHGIRQCWQCCAHELTESSVGCLMLQTEVRGCAAVFFRHCLRKRYRDAKEHPFFAPAPQCYSA